MIPHMSDLAVNKLLLAFKHPLKFVFLKCSVITKSKTSG